MDLRSFVAESLIQILEGIKDAQSRTFGENIAADGYISSTGNLIAGGKSGFFTMVDFDVSVLAESNEGGNNVRVASIESNENSTKYSQNSSRVKFSVHLRLPPGAPLPTEHKSRSNYESSYRPVV